MWQGVADAMAKEFGEKFQFEPVSRKWTTLVNGYKNCITNDKLSGNNTSTFEF